MPSIERGYWGSWVPYKRTSKHAGARKQRAISKRSR